MKMLITKKLLSIRYFIKKKELKYKFLQSIYLSEIFTYCIKSRCFGFLKIFNMVTFRNFCYYTKRVRGVLGSLNISRFIFRKFVNLSYLEGFRKSSW